MEAALPSQKEPPISTEQQDTEWTSEPVKALEEKSVSAGRCGAGEWLCSDRASCCGSSVHTVPPNKQYDTQDTDSKSAWSAAMSEQCLEQQQKWRDSSQIKISTDEEKLIGTVYGKERVRQEVLGHGLGGGRDCDINFLQNTTFHYPPSQWV